MTQPRFEVFEDPQGTWMVDWRIIRSILRSNANQHAQLSNSETRTTSQVNWLNPFSWQMPDIVNFEVNWTAQRRDRESSLEAAMTEATNMVSRVSYQEFRTWMRQRVDETESYRTSFRNKMQRASRATMQNINSSVESYGTSVAVARGVRDVSADAVLVGATFMTGGAAAAAAGGGSLLKGAFSYQDNGDIGLAALETTASFVTTMIPVARAGAGAQAASASIADEAAVVLVSLNFDVAKAVIQGDSFDQALARAATSAVTGQVSGAVLGQVARNPRVQRLVGRLPLPATIRVSRSSAATVSVPELGGRTIEALVGGAASSQASGLVASVWTPAQRQQAATPAAAQPAVCTASEQGCAQLEALDLAVQRIGSTA